MNIVVKEFHDFSLVTELTMTNARYSLPCISRYYHFTNYTKFKEFQFFSEGSCSLSDETAESVAYIPPRNLETVSTLSATPDPSSSGTSSENVKESASLTLEKKVAQSRILFL